MALVSSRNFLGMSAADQWGSAAPFLILGPLLRTSAMGCLIISMPMDGHLKIVFLGPDQTKYFSWALSLCIFDVEKRKDKKWLFFFYNMCFYFYRHFILLPH